MYFVGILAMPYRDFLFQINTESLEVGVTGMREAAVSLLRDEKPPEDREPVMVESADELFELMGSSRIRRIPSDDEEYDASFPNHPLSKVRALQRRILQSLEVADVVKNSKPYRAKET